MDRFVMVDIFFFFFIHNPRVTFILMGQVVIERTEANPNVLVTQPAFVQKWNKDFHDKMKDKCAKYFDFN